MNNWIEEAAQRHLKAEEEKRERALIDYTMYLRNRALAGYFWRTMQEVMETNVTGLNHLRPHSLWRADENKIVALQSALTRVEIDFNEIVPLIEIAIWRRPASRGAGNIPTRKRLTFNLTENDVYVSGEDGQWGAASAAEYLLDLALYGEWRPRSLR